MTTTQVLSHSPSNATATLPSLSELDKNLAAVTEFLSKMNQGASESSEGGYPAFWPAGNIKLLIEACHNVANGSDKTSAVSEAELTQRALGSATTVVSSSGMLTLPELDAALRSAAHTLFVALDRDQCTLETLGGVLTTITPFIPELRKV